MILVKQLSIVEVTTKYIHTNLKNLFYWIRALSLATLFTNSVTDSLTPSCLVNLIEVTLARANSKLVDVVIVVDEDRVGNSVLQIWKLRFGHEAKLLLRL